MSTPSSDSAGGSLLSLPSRIARALAVSIDRNILDLGRQMRLSYLPPLMVYVAAGISGLTAIVGTFFVKEHLGLSAEFLAALGFWMMLPWALKMPLGHLVDLIWRWKAGLVYLGAALIASSLLIMIGLLGAPGRQCARSCAVEAWYVTAALLAPVGYVLQDVVADAMTVEAVPRIDAMAIRCAEDERKLMHITMQTLGRVAIIGGSSGFAGERLMFAGARADRGGEGGSTCLIYALALVIPLISCSG